MRTTIQNRNTEKARRKVPTGRHVRFPPDMIQWLEGYAKRQGFGSDADAIRQIVREKRQQDEQSQSVAA